MMRKLTLQSQTGFALMVFLVVVMGIAGTAGFGLLSRKVETVNENKAKHDYDVLQKARQALLNYAVDYSVLPDTDEMGSLPCPDRSFITVPPEGEQEGTCGVRHANSSGYLPWKALGIDMLVDSSGECLWYVVSGDYKKGATKADMLNEDTNGLLWVQDETGQAYHGADPGDRPIALIIAPGGILQGQNHVLDNVGMVHCRGNYTEANYIESGGSVNYATDHVNTADAIWTYVYGSLSSRLDNSNFNDKIIWISKNEYWEAVNAQKDLDATVAGTPIYELTSDIADCLADYANDANNENFWLPWPANIDLSEYRNDDDNGGANEYVDQNNPTSLMGRLPQDITNSENEEALVTGTQTAYYVDRDDIFETCGGPDDVLWQNWKDHFFYVVAKDFEMNGSTVVPITLRCAGAGDCLKIDGESEDFAAIVFYSASVAPGQSRNSSPVDADEKGTLANYLDTIAAGQSNAHDYPADAVYTGAGGDVNQYYNITNISIGDLAFCLEPQGAGIVVTDCT